MGDDEERRQASQGSGLTARQEYWLRFYKQYHQDVRRYFARHVKCSHDVDDLIQTVFLNLLAHRGGMQNPHAYLCAAARHQLCSYWRARSRHSLAERVLSRVPDDPACAAELCDRDSDPLHQLGLGEMHQTVAAMIAGLSPALSEALRLRYIDGLKLDAAAACAGCSCFALKKRLARAKRSLGVILRSEGGAWDG
jgi:RNA polymerase sigma factor (sigma-70 family)